MVTKLFSLVVLLAAVTSPAFAVETCPAKCAASHTSREAVCRGKSGSSDVKKCLDKNDKDQKSCKQKCEKKSKSKGTTPPPSEEQPSGKGQPSGY
jgi:hypothetical protein